MHHKGSLFFGVAVSALFITAGGDISYAKDVYAPSGQTFSEATQNIADRVFSEAERATIEEYFGSNQGYSDNEDQNDDEDDNPHGHGHGHGNGHGHGGGLPPGLAKKDHLPPGLEKQLERNGHLPPGLEKRSLPHDLASRLPAAPKGTERVLVGNDVVLMDKKSKLILDIIELATQ